MQKEEIRQYPKSRLRDCIALGILCYCMIRTEDIIISFMVYVLYLMWSIIPIMIYEDYLKRKAEKNDHKEA
jgi:cytosine/uracil/thiamine/allantoin permease